MSTALTNPTDWAENGTHRDWLRQRKRGVGASEIAAVMGLSSYGSPYSVWADKTSEEVCVFEETSRQYWGKRLESLIAEEFAKETGLDVLDPGDYAMYWHRALPMFATIDRYAGDGGVLELKTAGADRTSDWSGGPPVQYLLQVQHQLAVTGAPHGYIAVLIGGNAFRWYRIERDEDTIRDIEAAVEAFWEFVDSKTPPPVDGHKATSEALKRLFPERPGADGKPQEVWLDDASIAAGKRLIQLEDQIEVLQDEADALENALKAALGEATYGYADDVVWTLKSTHRKGSITVAAEQKEALEAAGIPYRETGPTVYRTLRSKAVQPCR